MITMPCFASSNVNFTMPHCQQFSNHYAQEWLSPWFVIALMGTTEGLFMTLQVLLQIIRSRLHLQELSQGGFQSKYLASLSGSLIIYNTRCTALPNDIDGLRGRRTWAFIDELLDTLDSKTLWDEYGIDDDILVCGFNFKLLIFIIFSDCESVALYSWLSTGWYLWNSNTQLASSSYKRIFKRSSRHLGWRVSHPWTWRSASKWNPWWHWQAVRLRVFPDQNLFEKDSQ